jgi:hypothetical protein
MEAATEHTRSIGPHSRRIALGMIDGRRREARLMQAVRAELVAHVGGRPSAVQRRLIERAAILHLRLVLMDAQTAPGGGISEKNAREYVCWHNAYVRTLRELGLKGTAERPPSLADILAGHTSPNGHAPPRSAPPGPVELLAGTSARPGAPEPPAAIHDEARE